MGKTEKEKKGFRGRKKDEKWEVLKIFNKSRMKDGEMR